MHRRNAHLSHEYRTEEISDLLNFTDPLWVVEYCWKVNMDKYVSNTDELIHDLILKELFPTEKTQARHSLKSCLEEAK